MKLPAALRTGEPCERALLLSMIQIDKRSRSTQTIRDRVLNSRFELATSTRSNSVSYSRPAGMTIAMTSEALMHSHMRQTNKGATSMDNLRDDLSWFRSWRLPSERRKCPEGVTLEYGSVPITVGDDLG